MQSLADLVEQALTRHEVTYITDLERIAKRAGHKVVHTTLAAIRKGTYRSRPSRQTLEAIAWLAGVSYEAAHEAAGLGKPGLAFREEIPDDANILTPKQREAFLRLLRVMIEAQRSISPEIPERQDPGVLELTLLEEDVPPGNPPNG